MNRGGFKQYLKYSIGEIILLVCGILIALQINNWNSTRIARNELTTVLERVSADLELDIEEAQGIVKQFKTERTEFDSIFNGNAKTRMYENPAFAGHHCNYNELTISRTGYQQLINIKSEIDIKKDSLILEVTDFYAQAESYNSSMVTLIKNTVSQSLEYYRDNYAWYPAFLSNDMNDEIIKDIYFDTRSRNYIEHYRMIALRNYLPFLEKYIQAAEDLKTKIDDRLTHEN